MFRRITAIIDKEFIQIIRDPLALFLLFSLPVFILCIFGYAINLDVRNISLAVLDRDRTETSRALIERFSTSGYFVLKQNLTAEEDIARVLDHGEVKVVIKIPDDYQRDIAQSKNTPLQILIDGSDSNTANIAMSYVKAIVQEESMKIIFELLNSNGQIDAAKLPSLDLRPNIWYNPELASTNFLVPGIIGIIIMVIGALRMSVSLVKEKEKGTIECLMVSPLKPIEMMIGKITPYILIVFIDLILIVVVGKFMFHVPFRGSILLFMVLSFLFLGSALGSGLFVSAVSRSSQVAWTLGFFITVMPSIILSGFIFPIESMPMVIQFVTYLFPVRYFLTILRGIILKGVGLSVLYPQALILLFFAVATLAFSALQFKKRYSS